MAIDKNPVFHASPEVVTVAGSFAMNGTSDPVVAGIKGRGIKSVTYVATGKYLVTLRGGPFVDLLCGIPHAQSPSGGTYYAAVLASKDLTTAPENPTFVIQLVDWAGAAVAPHSAATDYIVHLTLQLACSGRTTARS